MTKTDDNNIFIKSVKGAKPLKKTDKVIKRIPKTKLAIKKMSNLEINEKRKIYEKTKIFPPKELKIEKNTINKKLKKGQILIDRKIDFHGCSLAEAKQIFLDTISDCFVKNYRCLLFITGKGVRKKPIDNLHNNKLFYSKIRNDFMSWTLTNKVQSRILNVQQANPKYGGDGAFFVYLRKNKN